MNQIPIAAFVLSLILPAVLHADPQPLAGAWMGELVAGPTRARVVLRIEEGTPGLSRR